MPSFRVRQEPGRRWPLKWRLAVTLLCWLLGSMPAQAAEPLEYQVKAAFLYNFARFIEWPVDTYADRFSICVLGEDPFGAALQRLAEKQIRGVQIQVRRLSSIDGADSCQVLFIASSERHALVEVLAHVAGKPVLTVSDIKGFARVGGIVEFYLDRKRIRFAVNPRAAHRAGLSVSSKLLSLARVVDHGSHSAGGGNARLR